MNFKKWLTTILILMALAILIDFLFIHLLFPRKKNQIIQTLNQQVSENLKNNPPQENALEISMPKPLQKSQVQGNFSVELKKCFPDFLEVKNSEDLIQKIRAEWPVEKSFIGIENFHYKNQLGQERRLHLTLDERKSNQERTIKVFKLDSDGLPEKISDQELKELNIDIDHIDKYLSAYKVNYHQAREDILFINGIRAFINKENDIVSELQILAKEKTFSCIHDLCQCQ